MLEIKKININSKDKQILNNLSFNVPLKSITAFVGNNGAGKTTTIKSILNLVKINSGEIFLNNQDILSNDNLLNVYFFPDLNNVILNLSGYEYLKYYQILFRTQIDKKEIKIIVEKFHLEKLWNKKMKKLSSGEKKKVLIIIMILLNRDYIILDEPTANLDVSSKELLLDILLKLKQKGKTILITSHIIEELQMIADHLVIIDDGEIFYNNEFNNEKEKIKDIFESKVKKKDNVEVLNVIEDLN